LEQVFSNRDGLLKKDSAPRSKTQIQQQGNVGQAAQLAAINPSALTSGNIAQLQKTLGNQAVTQLLSRQPVQRTTSPEEEEPLQGKFHTVQRQSPEEEEPLQGKFQAAQCKSPEEEEPLQGKFATVQRSAEEEEELQA